MSGDGYVLRNARLPPFPLLDRATATNVAKIVDVTIEDGTIAGVSSAETNGAPRSSSSIDLDGALVLPGFVDAHTHLGWAAESVWSVDWSHAHDRSMAVDVLRGVVGRVPEGFWILGGGWSREGLPDDFLPTLAQLDALSGDRPLLLVSEDQDLALLNSRALRLARVDDRTPSPVGGEIERDEAGRVTGRLRGTASRSRIARGVVPPRDRHRELAEMRSVLQIAAGMGITELHDIATLPGSSRTPLINEERGFTDGSIFLDLARVGELTARVSIRPSLVRVGELSRRLRHFANAHELLSAHGFKLTIDNGAFRDRPSDDAYSFRYPGFESSRQLMAEADCLGWPVSIHALGDLGVTEALDLFESVGTAPRSPRIRRLVHARRIAPDDLRRMAALRVIVETQPWEIVGQGPLLGGRFEDADSTVSPYRSMLDAGVSLAFSSDWRVGLRPDLLDVRPLAAQYIASTRRSPEVATAPAKPVAWQPSQVISPLEAVIGQVGGVKAAGAAARRGVIGRGRQADLVILSKDVTRSEAEAFLDTRVVGTIVAGRIVHLDGPDPGGLGAGFKVLGS